jgi:membrane-associated protease RseP (regulator of RpoE activity)
MAFTLGVVLFALGILISVCLHEAGHMVTAKAFGMKVTQYFAGFGPRSGPSRRARPSTA